MQLADNLAAFKSLQRNVAEGDDVDDLEALAMGSHLAAKRPGADVRQGAGEETSRLHQPQVDLALAEA